jgi:ABC-type glycerol-3-phosphate transport system substrate-binding protein
MDAVSHFNLTNIKYRIEVKDYSIYDTEFDGTAGMVMMNTEILAGKVPDMILCFGIPYNQFASKGLFEDLYTYIDSDAELKRSDFQENIMKALEINGSLYQAVPGFLIFTLIGNPDVVGYESGWTLDEFYSFINSHKEELELFEYFTQKMILEEICANNWDYLINWEIGKCQFDSEFFVKLLELAREFPEEFDSNNYYDEWPEMMRSGRISLYTAQVRNFQSIQAHKLLFGRSFVYKGYQSENSNGHELITYAGVAMTSTSENKEGVWEFLRGLLMEEYQKKVTLMFPINIHALESMRDESMSATYDMNETGIQIEVPKSSETWGSLQIDYYASTQEEIDKVMALINSVEKLATYDLSVMRIILEEAEAYFQGYRSVEETAQIIQSRVSIYVAEQS